MMFCVGIETLTKTVSILGHYALLDGGNVTVTGVEIRITVPGKIIRTLNYTPPVHMHTHMHTHTHTHTHTEGNRERNQMKHAVEICA